ncbi:MAG TPA: type II toxin-antitoxin system Phd/YefM family antitoxin [Acetobacteraceae bacterium]|jgi:prevent-host-death family protein
MKIASITEAKNRLSALIDSLKAGSPVLIVDRGRPVARLEPVTGSAEDAQDGRLSRLLRDGVVRPRRGDPPRALFSNPPPRVRAGASGVDALTRERRQGR